MLTYFIIGDLFYFRLPCNILLSPENPLEYVYKLPCSVAVSLSTALS
jgi:hypothetical protein